MSKRILIAKSTSGNSNSNNNGNNNPKKSSQSPEVTLIATLASSISHELKNYLAAINISVELSEYKLRDIKKKIQAANYLITNLQLQIQGIVTGKPSKNDFELYSITKNIKEALEQYPFRDNERELVIVENFQDFKYFGNPNLTNHVFYNLIRNSLRAIHNAGKGEITISLKLGKEFNKLIFKDTGSGINKKFLPKIFDLFEIQSAKQGGTGIGLAFCKEIMKSYNGEIICRSKKGHYTEFTLKFPVVVSDERVVFLN